MGKLRRTTADPSTPLCCAQENWLRRVRGIPGLRIETWGTRQPVAPSSPATSSLASPHLEHDDGFVVKAVGAVLYAADVGEDGFGDLAGRELSVAAKHGGEALVAVHLVLRVLRVENAVGDKNNGVARLGVDAVFLV